MKKRALGKNGLTVSAIGFGCMGINHHRGKALSQKEADSLLRSSFEAGITLFDTAELYGPETNEIMVGKALAPIRDRVVIATKFGIFDDENGKRYLDSRPERIRNSVENSLRRLNIETIDLYYQHRYDRDVPIEEVAGVIRDLMRQGKVKHWGLSEASEDVIRRAHAALPLAAVQSEYSIMWREPRKTLMPTLEELGIGFVPFSPLGRGFLTGAITKDFRFEATDSRNSTPFLKPEHLEKNQAILQLLQQCANVKHATVTQMALAWMLAQKPWIVPIPGTKSLERVKENVGVAEIQLTPAELDEMNRKLEAIGVSGYDADSKSATTVGIKK